MSRASRAGSTSSPAGANGLLFHSFLASQVTPYYDAASRGGWLGLGLYHDRADMRNVRTKSVNQLMVDCHHRPRTVILFTHRDSLAGFRNTLPPRTDRTSPSLTWSKSGVSASFIGARSSAELPACAALTGGNGANNVDSSGPRRRCQRSKKRPAVAPPAS